jgi:hypothetical protein
MERQKAGREQRQALEAEVATKQELESAAQLEELRKQKPKSGDGAGEGTSA